MELEKLFIYVGTSLTVTMEQAGEGWVQILLSYIFQQ